MAIITRANAKTLLNITDTSKDERIDLLIPIIENYIIKYCNNEFSDSGVQVFPIGIRTAVISMLAFHLDQSKVSGVQSESIGDYSVTFGSGGDYPAHILKGLKTYCRASYV